MPPPPQNPTPGFISMQQWLDANRGAVDAMGRTLADAGAAQAHTAQEEADQYAANQRAGATGGPSYSDALADQRKANQALQGWNSYGGLYDQAQQQYGKQGTYTPGANTLDALLLGSAGPQQGFRDVQKQYGGLDHYLQSRDTTRAAPPTAPKGAVNQTPLNYAPTPQRPGGGTFAPDNRRTRGRGYEWRV